MYEVAPVAAVHEAVTDRELGVKTGLLGVKDVPEPVTPETFIDCGEPVRVTAKSPDVQTPLTVTFVAAALPTLKNTRATPLASTGVDELAKVPPVEPVVDHTTVPFGEAPAAKEPVTVAVT